MELYIPNRADIEALFRDRSQVVFGEYGPLTFDPSERYLRRLHHNSFSPSCLPFGEQLNVLCFTHCLCTEGQSGSKQHVEMLLCFSPSVSALEILHQG